MTRSILIALAAAITVPAMAFAQAGPAGQARIAPLDHAGAIALPAPVGAAPSSETWSMLQPGNPVVRNVTQPTLTPVLPAPGKATGAAVIVAPGGGFLMLSMNSEGFAVARALADRGIAAFVLKYRLESTPTEDKAFIAAMSQRFRPAPGAPGAAPPPTAPPVFGRPEATADALAALRLIRSRAAEWHVDPARVGVMGFSAGAMTALALVQTVPTAEQPAFFGYIYGPQTVEIVPAEAPPLFDAIAFDDPLFRTAGFLIAAAWQQAKRKVELHAYQRGGHGFGGLGARGTTTTLLLDQFTAWLTMQGFLTSKGDK